MAGLALDGFELLRQLDVNLETKPKARGQGVPSSLKAMCIVNKRNPYPPI